MPEQKGMEKKKRAQKIREALAPGRVERDEHGEARPANLTPNGGPHIELERLRPKTWSKFDLSNAGTTWPTYELGQPRRC